MNQTAISSIENIINKYQDNLSFNEHPEIFFACVYLEHNGLNFRDEFVNYIEVESSDNRDISMERFRRLNNVAEIAAGVCLDLIFDDILSNIEKYQVNFKDLSADFSLLNLSDNEIYKNTVEYLFRKLVDVRNEVDLGRIYSSIESFLLSSHDEFVMSNEIYIPICGLCGLPSVLEVPSEYELGEDEELDIFISITDRNIEFINKIYADAFKNKNVRFNYDYDENLFNLYDDYTYKHIVAALPRGSKELIYSSDADNDVTQEEFVIRNFMTGKQFETALLIYPIEFCKNPEYSILREWLVNMNVLRFVTQLPAGVFNGIDEETVLIFLEKEYFGVDFSSRHIPMLDSRLYITDSGFNDSAAYEQYFNYITGREYDHSKLIFLPKKFISENNFSLLPSDYVQKYETPIDIPEDYELLRLSDLVEYHHIDTVSTAHYPVITKSDLGVTPYSDINMDEIKRSAYYNHDNVSIIESDLILLSPLYDELRATHYKYAPYVYVAYDSSVYGFIIKSELVTYEYLIHELWSEYVHQQCALLKSDSYEGLTPTQLLSIKILVPKSGPNASKLLQERIANNRDDFNRAKIEQLGDELKFLKDTRHDEFVRGIRMRKHAIEQVLNDLCPAMSTLIAFKEKNGGQFDASDIVSSRSGMTVDDYFHHMKRNLDKITYMVDKLADEFIIPEGSRLDLVEFIKDYCENHTCSSVSYSIEYHLSKALDQNPAFNSLLVPISSDWMYQVFDNICANAARHGFIDGARTDYSIRIDLLPCKLENGDVGVCISVANNGAPLTNAVSSDKIYTWGVSSNGTGIGAYEVKEIIEAAGGSVDFESNPNEKSGYCVKYKLMLPLILL